MFSLLLSPLSIFLTVTTSFGVLIHDTQLDRIVSTAAILPAGIAVFAATESLANDNAHPHNELVSVTQNIEQLRSDQLVMQQPRGSQDKKYITSKRLTSSTEGSEYHWPSI